ncbi:ornithine carbamoyltransferase [Bacillus testis]|uniref:ornithine carbamoyltransferase n=1 Tax=Bacillus testis TaxID=1622072 RepID=UPI00067E9190|nr:ornithine carbamoyltransferase [Bacillus testis]
MSALTKKETDRILGTKDFLTLTDVSGEQILSLLALAEFIKRKHSCGEEYAPLKNKTLAMIFEKSSTRTRVSFEIGMLQLGGHALFLSSQDLQLGRGETISDSAHVLSEYVDGMMIRTFGHDKIQELADNASIPVINGLTDSFHPCQALADLLTIKELRGTLPGLKVAYIGDGNNVAHSLMEACVKVGMKMAVATPKGYEPDPLISRRVSEMAEQAGGQFILTNDPLEAVEEADIIYSDVWTSMGQEHENQQRLQDFIGFQVNEKLASYAKQDYLFMHCLPAHRGEEVSAAVIDGEHSVVFHQAGNRLHAQKAILVDLLAD